MSKNAIPLSWRRLYFWMMLDVKTVADSDQQLVSFTTSTLVSGLLPGPRTCRWHSALRQVLNNC